MRRLARAVPFLPLLDALCHVLGLPHPEGFGYALRDALALHLEA